MVIKSSFSFDLRPIDTKSVGLAATDQETHCVTGVQNFADFEDEAALSIEPWGAVEQRS